jgi:hypothetical protein
MIRALRTLTPARLTDVRAAVGNARARSAGFTIALLAVIVAYAISGNSLENLGIDYGSPGGNPLIKLHPATYLTSLACFVVLFIARPAGSGLVRLFRMTPALAAFNILILFCAFYSIANVGYSGASIYVESYLSAGILAVALESGTDRQKRALAWWIIGFCLLSVLISVVEGATKTHLIPPHIISTLEETKIPIDSENFRGDGLFGHPLTAAVAASMGTFLLLRMQMNALLKGVLFTTFMVGLLSFGGRASLVTTVTIIGVAAGVVLVRGLVRRDLSLRFLAAIGAAMVILLPLLIMLVLTTNVGERIITHMYADDSVSVRNTQWLVLNYLNLNDVLFGVPPVRLELMKYQIGLGEATTDIENFWLLMFLNLGVIGFVVFLFALALFILHLGRRVNHPLGWMLLLAAILVDSTSNSLGRKSPDLFFMTACLIAMTGYSKTALAATRSISRAPPNVRGRSADRLGLRPSPVNLAGFKS